MSLGRKIKHSIKRHLTWRNLVDPLVGGALQLGDKRSTIRKAVRSVKHASNWRANLGKYLGGGSRSAALTTYVPPSNARSYQYQYRPISGLV